MQGQFTFKGFLYKIDHLQHEEGDVVIVAYCIAVFHGYLRPRMQETAVKNHDALTILRNNHLF